MIQWKSKVRPKSVVPTYLLVCGTRTFEDYILLARTLDRLCFWFDDVILVTGGQKKRVERGGEWVYVGADHLAMQWAEKNWYSRQTFYPDWDRYGLRAGPKRNQEMVDAVAAQGGFLVAFWDGRSPGTKDCVKRARRALKPGHIRVVRY